MKIKFFLLIQIFTMVSILAQSDSIRIFGPTSGVTSAAYHQKSKFIIVGSLYAGIFKSTDEGVLWNSASDGYPILPASTFAASAASKFVFDPIDSNLIYVCTGTDDTGGGMGVLKSTDGGETWNKSNSGLTTTDGWISDISINPKNHNELFAVGNRCLFKSTNQANSWIKINGIDAIGLIVFDKNDSLLINGLASDNSILESTDGGNSFIKYYVSTQFGSYIRYTCLDSTTGDVYFSTYQGIYKISNWRNIEYLDPSFPIIDSSIIINGGKITALAKISYSKLTGYIFVATNSGVFRSTNHGSNWTLVATDYNGCVLCKDNLIYLFSREGVKISCTDGLNWNLISDGPTTSVIYDMDIFPSDNKNMIAGTDQGVYTSSDSGRTWDRINYELFDYASCIKFEPSNHSVIYVGLGGFFTTKLGLYKSTDAGVSWINISPQSGLPVTAINIHPDEPQTIYVGSPGAIWKSVTGGYSWDLMQIRPGDNETGLIKISKSNPDIIYVSATANHPETTGIYISEDGGNTWERRISGFPYGVSYTGVTALAIHPENSQIALTGNWADGVYHTSNMGDYWEKVNNFPNVGFYNHAVLDIVFNCIYFNNLYATVAGGYPTQMTGLYKSNDMGNNWEKVEFEGMANNSFNKLLFFDSDNFNRLFLGTLGNGIVEFTSATQINSIETEATLEDYSLSQNYPNPFNPSTIINYSLKEAGLVRIKVYDILGSEVAVLLNETKEAGNYAVEFNASNLPSGVYIYTMQVNEYTASYKMLFLK